MANIHAYLTFSGNCRAAMTFYQQCLGGELTLQTVGDSPLSENLPPQMQACVVNATLTRGDLVLIGTDMVSDDGLTKGNQVAMILNCDSEEEALNTYNKLSAGGVATHPIQAAFWGALFGDLVDKFGNCWLLRYDKAQTA